jgi:cytochrome b561
MRLRNSAQGYGAVAVLLHWLTAAFVVLAWLLGTFGDVLPRASRAAGLSVHIAAGLAIIAFVALRLGWRLVDPPPPIETTRFGTWLGIAARVTHFALYALLIATPALGIALQFARGNALPIFGLAEIASPWIRDRAFASSTKELHETSANLLMMVAALHTAAALAHHWLWRDRTLGRMLPWVSR